MTHLSQRYIFQAGIIVAALVSSFLLLVHRIVTTAWLEIFVNNADSLVLPLVKQSLGSNEPFAWIFSSQVFLFPEGVMYAAASMFVQSIGSALLINAFMNYVILAGLLYVCFRLTKLSRQLSGFFSLYACLFVVGIAWLEKSPTNNRFLAMPFFTTTYYAGVVLSSLAALGILLYVVNATKRSLRITSAVVVVLAGICLLTTASNPMFVLQFVMPISLVLGLARTFGRISWRMAGLLLAPLYVGTILGTLARKTILASYIAADTSGYVHFGQQQAALDRLTILFREARTDHLQRFELLAVGLIILASFSWFVWLCIQIAKKQKRPTISPASFIMAGLGGLTPLLLLGGLVASGNSELRYLLPVVIFPFLSLGSLAILPALKRPKLLRVTHYIGLAVCLGVIALVILCSQPLKGVRTFISYYPADASCLDRSLQNTPYRHGVAQFWRARTLQLHSKSGVIVSQVTPDLATYDWMSNRAVYQARMYDFVVADSPTGAGQYLTPLPEKAVVNILGEASDVYDCGPIVIYGYKLGTPGYNLLNAQLR